MAICSLQKPLLLVESKDPKTWDSILHSHTKLKDDQAILTTYTHMEILGVVPQPRSFPLVLKACARLKAVDKGRKIHSHILHDTTLSQDLKIRTALIDFYCKCGLLHEARQVFEETTHRDVISWNAIICGFASGGCPGDALRLFYRMQQSENIMPTSITLVGLLLACGELLELRLGQEIHCYCLRRGLLDFGPYLGTALLTFYSRFDNANPSSSSFIFNSMLTKNTVTWNALMSSYFSMGDSFKALTLFTNKLLDGVHPSRIAVLVAIQSSTSLEVGKQIHQIALKLNLSDDLFLASALIQMYARHGNPESSIRLFEAIPTRDVALWNAMMSVFKECGNHQKVFGLFSRMRSHGYGEDSTTVAIVLSAISESTDNLGKDRGLHAHVVKNGMAIDVPLGNELLNMYCNLNCVDSAQRIFYEIERPNLISWNTIILALARQKLLSQISELLERMRQSSIKPNSFTMVAVLAACKDEKHLNIGRSIHGYVIRQCLDLNLSLCTAFTDMYLNCGDEKTAKHLFYSIRNKDLVSWNALITCYIDNNRHNDALLLFYEMLNEVQPNSVTIINIISSCVHLASLPLSRCIHAYAARREFTLGSDISMGNALVTMYARCGSICSAEKVFNSLRRRDVVSWNAMIAAYGMHGCGKEALNVFSQMKKNGLTPTTVTFVSVLSACSHAGLIKEGWEHFYSMSRDYGINPEVLHYACMVDLLGRGGFLDEARKFISLMPIEPDASVWRALLSACRVYSESGLARRVFKKLVELEPMNVGNYILVSNICAAEGLWEDVERLRTELKNNNFAKPIANSWIVIRSKVHKFTAGDTSHPDSNNIYLKLSLLMTLIKNNGYIPDRRWVFQDIKDEEKDERLLSHSEKLAIAFGLLYTKGETPIFVNKNLRVCGDCHTFSKYISKFVGREIVLRDATRFHHFVNGVCSCNDYW